MSLASRTFQRRQALDKEIKDVYAKFTTGASVAATATLDLTVDIILTSVSALEARNTTTFTIQVAPAAANPTNTVLAAFTGTAAAITVTITPNDGTNNGAVAVPLTTAELRELITTGSVVGKTVTVTDGSSLRALQTATGGGPQNLADGGQGDGVVGTFSGASVVAPINSSVLGIASITRNGIGDYTITLQDAYVSLRNAKAIALSAAAQDIQVQIKSESVASAKTVRILATAGASPVEPTSGTVFLVKFELKNSSV